MLHQKREAGKHGETQEARREQLDDQPGSGCHQIDPFPDEGFFISASWCL